MRFAVPLAAAGCAAFTAPPAPSQIRISEIRIDEPGPGLDPNEYVELAGPPGASLDGLTYLVLGDTTAAPLGSGVIESVIKLSGNVIPPSGFFVVAEPSFTLGTANLTKVLEFEDNDNVSHLLVSGFSGADEDDLDTDDDGVLDVTPWTSVIDRVAAIRQNNPPSSTEWHYGPPVVGPVGTSAPAHVFRNGASAVLSSWNIGATPLGVTDSPGAPNPAPTVSIAVGGTQRLALDAGPGFAGSLYVIVTNFTGTAPGLFVPPILLPLNFDTLVSLSLESANGPVWSNSLGFLDANGRAFAALNVPALPSDAMGLSLQSAAVLLGPLFVPLLASNPVPLDLVL
ncbi:MAG: hypothetical protein ACREIU_14180 [Planctomycetota bacterium]